jgi:hypothetical protein
MLLASATACSGLDDKSGSRTLTGAAVGAGVGAGAGLLTGGVVGKAATGAAAGAAGGLIYDQVKKNDND